MQVQVTNVHIPAMSTIAMITGIDTETGDTVAFGGDHRASRDIGEAILAGKEVVVDVEDWQVLSIISVP